MAVTVGTSDGASVGKAVFVGGRGVRRAVVGAAVVEGPQAVIKSNDKTIMRFVCSICLRLFICSLLLIEIIGKIIKYIR